MANSKITNVGVYGLDESVIASGYPMSWGILPEVTFVSASNQDVERGKKLGNAPSGSGHDSFLKGIIVQFDWRISQTVFPQVERYHFIDIVSSQSKMHRIQTATTSDFNPAVDDVILARFMELVKEYNKTEAGGYKAELRNELIYSCPMGYELTARFTTNYLQLKTIYKQRKNHRLKEWKDFCKWVEGLPHFKQLTGIDTE